MAYNGEAHDIIMGNTVGSLTQLQRSVIIGSVLGDGYLRIVPGRKNAFLEINHSWSAKEYVDWKFDLLKSICRSGPKKRNGNGSRIAYRFTTRQHPEITELYNLFYQEKRKRIPQTLSLDPIVMAIWFMDDGSRCGKDNLYLNTQQFSLEEQEMFRAKLKELNIESSLNRDKIYWRVRIAKRSMDLFYGIVRKYIAPSMEYKMSYNPVETYSEMNRVSLKSDTKTPSPFGNERMKI